jgi:hypothetical protein
MSKESERVFQQPASGADSERRLLLRRDRPADIQSDLQNGSQIYSGRGGYLSCEKAIPLVGTGRQENNMWLS